MSTPVIFRKTEGGELFAAFPTMPSPKTSPDNFCMGMTERGEILVDLNLFKHTKPAAYEDYGSFLNRLYNKGNSDLEVVQRIKSEYNDMRYNAKRGIKHISKEKRPVFIQAA